MTSDSRAIRVCAPSSAGKLTSFGPKSAFSETLQQIWFPSDNGDSHFRNPMCFCVCWSEAAQEPKISEQKAKLTAGPESGVEIEVDTLQTCP